MQKLTIAIIGGGPAALMAADVLSQKAIVHLYEKGKTLGRKFLVAGKGGFNLTNAATAEDLYKKYTPQAFLQPALTYFDTIATREWLWEIGIPTFVGSSGRVFPEKGIKPIAVLQKIKRKLVKQDVQFHFNHEFVGFSEDKKPIIKYGDIEETVVADKYIFALGGASWKVTGSGGSWLDIFTKKGIKTIPFQSSNCGINVAWPQDFIQQHNGVPLKNIQVSCQGFQLKGEALLTKYGLEGNAVYPIIPSVRKSLAIDNQSLINIDLKPNSTNEQLSAKITGQKISPKNYKYIFNLTKTELALAKLFCDKDTYLSPVLFTKHLKNISIPITSLRPIEEAISTVGGIDISELNANFSLCKIPHFYAIGEMLDWDAPTGGFLLQGCFSMGAFVGEEILVNK